MTYKYIILFALAFTSIKCEAQDTIKMGRSYLYSSKQVKELSGKGFNGKYGREVIRFSDKHFKVENCYYNNSIRTCYGYYYDLINDSTLTIKTTPTSAPLETWIFNKLPNGSYYVHRVLNGFLESGIVDTLIPLRYIEPFITTSLDKTDTLWQTNHFTCMNRKHGIYICDFNVSKINDPIYDFDEIDEVPQQLNGDSLSAVEIKSVTPCYGDPLVVYINTVTCIVTADGKIKNIEQALGNLSEGCSQTMMEINRKIASWGTVKPAMRNGKAVTVRWFIKVNNLSQSKMHAAFFDTYENRKAFLKRRKLNE